MGPFEEHLRDAIRINRERRPRYSALTSGKSLFISDILIRSEQLSIPFAILTDLCSIPFRKRGIRVVELEFISMDKIPAFSEKLPFQAPSMSEFTPSRPGLMVLNFSLSALKGGWGEASRKLKSELHRLEATPGLHLMLKHILESMLRITMLAPVHQRKCKEQRLWISTTPISVYLYVSHLLAIPFASWLDWKTAPLLAEGVPILYQDVPAIPEADDEYK